MSVYEFGPFQLNAQRLTLNSDGEPIALGPRVVQTLLALVQRAGCVVEKDKLLDMVWPEGFVEEANLTQNVYVLRKTLAAHGMAEAIETIPRKGYRFTARVKELVQIPRPKFASKRVFTYRRRMATALSTLVFLAAAFALVASSGQGSSSPAALSERGARLYQIGLYYWNLRTAQAVEKSAGYFNQVIESDPLSARGYAGLADVNLTMGDYCYGTHRPAVYFARARAYAEKALALDPNSAQAHAALGFIALQYNDQTTGMTELRHAIAIDPSYAPAHEWYGIALLRGGDPTDGLRHLQIAADLDPLSPATTAWLASTALQAGRFGDAVTYSRQALELSPQRRDALLTMGRAYEAQGDYDSAIRIFKRYAASKSIFQREGAAMLARAYALSRGDKKAASRMLPGVPTHPMAFENAAPFQ
jgi:DNA-binding winged helix-turn-helix (wHTH) protein/Flp pilus assembly protein TadD